MDVSGIRSLSDLTAAAKANGRTELGRNQFLELMVAQLKHQDPMNPSDSQNFLAQLAQFSTLEGIQNLNTSVGSMAGAMRASVTMQASALVGHAVLVPTDQVLVQGNGLVGNVNVTAPTGSLRVEITDMTGAHVKNLDLGPAAAGDARFRWDLTDDSGMGMPPGVYKVRAFANEGDQSAAFATDLPEIVMSVSLSGDGAQLNLAGGTTVPVQQVKEIQ